ncbi:MAG: DUF86 domain-containing protein [Bdellovibrionota bacterium]
MPRDEATVLDIVLACRAVATYIRGLDKPAFLNDGKTQDAVLHRIIIVGEASKRLSPDFRRAYGEIPWKDVAGMRDRLIHDYNNVDFEIVWHVATQDLPRLLAVLEPLAPRQT